MKKFMILLVISLLLITSSVSAAVEQFILTRSPFPIIVNGQALKSDLPVLNYKGNTYIPLKKVGEALGVPVEFKDNKIVIGEGGKGDTVTNNTSDVATAKVNELIQFDKSKIKINSVSYSNTFTFDKYMKNHAGTSDPYKARDGYSLIIINGDFLILEAPKNKFDWRPIDINVEVNFNTGQSIRPRFYDFEEDTVKLNSWTNITWGLEFPKNIKPTSITVIDPVSHKKVEVSLE
ncbi:stalk domain-containing protein [Thermoanaerobacterium sp. DL9XJH110]|uniref:stalk domain-containing protein n=1 Tax=Thermoanaerobacterium sp. DL9XJH110 TaxID=3386643 RepID=UPI003BB55941